MSLKRQVRLALARLKNTHPNIQFVANDHGHIRYVWNMNDEHGLSNAFDGSPIQQARNFLRQEQTKTLFRLANIRLRVNKVADIGSLGYLVMYDQVQTTGKHVRKIRRSHLQIYINRNGVVWLAVSSLNHGSNRKAYTALINRSKAIAIAKHDFGFAEAKLQKCRLVLNQHKTHNDLAYEITLRCAQTRRRMEYVVNANNGNIVRTEDLTLFHSVPCNVFALIPEPTAPRPLPFQTSSLENLIDQNVFKTDQFRVLFKNTDYKFVELKPNADGSYNFSQDQREFEAVNAAFWINSLQKLFEECGGRKHTKVLMVKVCDDGFPNNAEFDPRPYMIIIGRGTGRKGGGYTPDEGNDGIFPAHEFGHRIVFILAPAGWLPGDEGRALNECLGDVMALIISYLFRLWHGMKTGKILTKQALINDPRIIGAYTAHPMLRELKTRLTIKDKNGRVHHDGLIPGGALLDLLVWFATSRTGLLPEIATLSEAAEIELGIRDFFKLLIAALNLVPADQVLFIDMVRVLTLADQKLSNGIHSEMIKKCFADHGITI